MAEPTAYTAEGMPISDADLPAAVAAGKAHFRKDQTVNLIDPYTGEHTAVSAAEADSKIRLGHQVLTNDQVAEYQRRKELGESGAHAAAALGLGSARTLSFGLSDVAVKNAGGQQYLQDVAAAHPALTTIGEITGYALPIAGELGVGGRVVKAMTAAPRLVSTGARAAGEAATAGVGKGLAKRTLGGTVTGTLEGLAYGTGVAVSDNAIRDEPITAQRLLFDSAAGAALGGVLGGLSHFGSKAAEHSSSPIKPALEGKPSLLAPLAQPAAEAVQEAGKPSLLGRLTEGIQGKAAEAEIGQTLKTAGYTGADIARLGKAEGAEGIARYANRIRNELGIQGGDSIGDVARRAQEAKTAVGARFDDIGQRLDELGVVFDRDPIHAQLESAVAKLREAGTQQDRMIASSIERKYLSEFAEKTQAPYLERAEQIGKQAEALLQQTRYNIEGTLQDEMSLGVRSGVNKREIARIVKQQLEEQKPGLLDKAREQIERSLGPVKPAPITFDEIRDLRGRWDKYEKFNIQRDTDRDVVRKQEMRKIRDVLEGALVNQIKEKASPELARAYIATKLNYKDLSHIAETSANRSWMASGNRLLSLSEQIGTGTGLVAGAVVGGHLLTGSALGAALFAVNRFAKSSMGTRVSAKILHAIAGDMSKLAEPVLIKEASVASQKMADSVSKTLDADAIKVKPSHPAAAYQVPVAIAKGTATLGEFMAHVDRAASLNTSHETALTQIDSHPDMRREVVSSQMRAMQMLKDFMPRNAAPPNPVLGEHQPPVPLSQAHEYAQIIHMMDRPSVILENFQDGTLTRKQANAMRQVIPGAMADFGKHVQASLARQIDKGKAPHYQTRLRVGILTGTPIDPSDSPQFAAAVQTAYQATVPPPPPPGRGPAKGSNGIGSRRQSFLDDSEI